MSWLKIDKTFLFLSIILVVFGFVVFLSSSMSLATRDNINLYKVIGGQLVLGILAGSFLAIIVAGLKNLDWMRKYAWWIFGFALLATAAVFSPIGFGYNGAHRWLNFGFVNFQPIELLKLGTLIILAKLFADYNEFLTQKWFGLAWLAAILAPITILLFLQPDMDGLASIYLITFALYFLAGAPWKRIGLIFLAGAVGFCLLAFYKPYIMDRLTSFMHPEKDPLGIGYQLNQSLIAIGSGQLTGKGIGQSIQKFKNLPESISDSIFPIAAEELGLIGSTLIIVLFLLLAFRGFFIAGKTGDMFSGLLVSGIVIMIMFQSFINIGSMTGVMPLSGLPLIFFSKGGSSLLFSILSLGIILNISKNIKHKKI
ncbi:MAG: putative peptidoglycan glycosyltransferase FtsW [bacterium]